MDDIQTPDDEIIQHRRDLPVVPCWMTKREYFAALAMQGLTTTTASGWGFAPYDRIASAAVQYADALIAALEQ